METVLGEMDLIFTGPKKNGLNADEKEADGDAGEGEGVREQHGLPVHHHQADEEETKDGEANSKDDFLRERRKRNPMKTNCCQGRCVVRSSYIPVELNWARYFGKPKCNYKLNERISPGN